MAYMGRKGAAAPLTSADIPDGSITTAKIVDDNVTAAKIPAGAVSSDVVYLENNASTQDLSGTYSTERLYFNDSYQLTGDVTVTGHLALGTIADADVVITQDSTERTITGSGTLESGNVLQDTHGTDLTGMTGELGSAVTGGSGLTALGTVTTGTFNGTLDSTTFSGDAGQRTAKAWVNFNGTGTVAIRDDYGVSSITDNNTGMYDVNLDTATTTNAASVCSGLKLTANKNSSSGYISRTVMTSTTQVNVYTLEVNEAESTQVDFEFITMVLFGD